MSPSHHGTYCTTIEILQPSGSHIPELPSGMVLKPPDSKPAVLLNRPNLPRVTDTYEHMYGQANAFDSFLCFPGQSLVALASSSAGSIASTTFSAAFISSSAESASPITCSASSSPTSISASASACFVVIIL